MEPFDPRLYGPDVEALLALDGDGRRPMPLVAAGAAPPEAAARLRSACGWFSGSAHPVAARAGLWLYFSGMEEAHALVQDDDSAEGHLWHAILHRQEPDAGNSAYWFRRAGAHPTQGPLSDGALEIVALYPAAEFRPSRPWDPFGFIAFCERARRQPGSDSERAALEIQLLEWQLLFRYCASPRSR